MEAPQTGKTSLMWLKRFNTFMRFFFFGWSQIDGYCKNIETLFYMYTSADLTYGVTSVLDNKLLQNADAWQKKILHFFYPPQFGISQVEISQGLTPFSGKSCKLQLHFARNFRSFTFIMQKIFHGKAATVTKAHKKLQ